MHEECFRDGPFIFRLNENGTGPQLLTQVCLERGWKEYEPESGDHWNLWWRTSGFPLSHHRNLYSWQFINHIPKGASICRKDNLVRYLRCMKKVYGSIYDFSPPGYNLPLEYTKLAAECSRFGRNPFKNESEKFTEERPVWICKPVAQSQGRGIFLFRKLSELNYDSNTIVQRYIEKPLLIGGYKFDLRLYICIPSYHPVTIYMYRDGLARFGTDKFTLNDLRNPFRHLTNSSINKLGPGYTEMKDRVGSGCKWTLKQLRRYFGQVGISDWLLWQRITSMVVLTVLSHMSHIPPTVNCFEFFGFDILIDSSLRPWLLEVNLSPALSNDCEADRSVKKSMLHEMFDLLGLPLYNGGLASVFDVWKENDQQTEEETDPLLSLSNNISVLNAAGRWRRKHIKMSARQINSSKSNSTIRQKNRSCSATFKNGVLPKSDTFISVPKHKPNYDPTNKNHTDEGNCRRNATKKWGNGRDWVSAAPREGSWVRIWPMVQEPCTKAPKNVKQMVGTIMKFTKTARDLAKNHPLASECQLNEFLQEEMPISGDIWMPPV